MTIEQPKTIDVISQKFSILPWLMLLSRLVLFLLFQASIALGFYIAKSSSPWEQSLKYWPLGIIVANVLCFIFLYFFYKSKGIPYFTIFKFQKESIKRDILISIGLLILFIIFSMAPNIGLATLLFNNPQAGLEMMDSGIPLWVKLVSLILFPLTQMFTEIPMYMVYCAPELEKQGVKSWLAFLLGALFLSFQHMAMPLILDGLIITYRLLMFIPLALFIGFVIWKKPRLLPYMIIIHGLMDLSLVITMLVL
ncbi:MAG: hypothetical protein ACFFDW_02630 [Candidatus Thorarchaeota archaeon]